MNAIPGPGTKGSARTIPTSKAAKPRNIRRCFDMPTPEGDLVRRWFQVCWPYLITSLSTSSVPDKCAPELAGCAALSERALQLISKSDCLMKRIAQRVMSVEYLAGLFCSGLLSRPASRTASKRLVQCRAAVTYQAGAGRPFRFPDKYNPTGPYSAQ